MPSGRGNSTSFSSSPLAINEMVTTIIYGTKITLLILKRIYRYVMLKLLLLTPNCLLALLQSDPEVSLLDQ